MQKDPIFSTEILDHLNNAIATLKQHLPEYSLAYDDCFQQAHGHLERCTFDDTLKASAKLATQADYQPDAVYLRAYKNGQLCDADIFNALAQDPALAADETIVALPSIKREAIYHIAMLYDLEAVLPSQLAWQIEEMNSLEAFQPDLPDIIQQQLLANPEQTTEKELVASLWQFVLNKLDLEENYLHPENMLDLSLDQAESLLAQHRASQKKVSLKKATMHERMQDAAIKTFNKELTRLGVDISLRELMMGLSGVDLLDYVRPQIIRICSSALDQGLAVWRLPGRSEMGLYAAWRAIAGLDINPFLHELPDWQDIIAELPEQAEAAIALQLQHLEIPEAQWPGYLRCLAVEIPGWSNLINQRDQTAHESNSAWVKASLADYLAIRLTLDRLWLNQICHDTWQIKASISSLRRYFRKNSSEYLVRHHLFRGNLPEHLIQQAESMTLSVGKEQYNRTDWQNLADIIWTWQGSAMTNSRPLHTIYDSAWQLFRIFQFLGFSSHELSAVSKSELETILKLLQQFNPQQRAKIWLLAYEQQSLSAIQKALISSTPNARPDAAAKVDIIFGVNRVENALRVQLSSINTHIRCHGSIAFSSICSPHEPQASPAGMSQGDQSKQAKSWSQLGQHLWHHSLRFNLLLAPLIMLISAPLIALKFLRALKPSGGSEFNHPQLASGPLDPETATAQPLLHAADLYYLAPLCQVLQVFRNGQPAAPLIVLFAEEDFSLTATPTATKSSYWVRTLAYQGNQAEMRQHLRHQGIVLPQDSWVIAAEYQHERQAIEWFDIQTIPESLMPSFRQLRLDCEQACLALKPSLADEQCGPQTATNAKAPLARINALILCSSKRNQYLSGASDVLLINYDSDSDQQQRQLKQILTQLIPSLLRRNLAYFFAGLDQFNFGSGNSLRHNPISQLGIMEGLSSDLKSGLAQQLTQAIPPQRLHLILEISRNSLNVLLQASPDLASLLKNDWLCLHILDPENNKLVAVSGISCNATEADALSDQTCLA